MLLTAIICSRVLLRLLSSGNSWSEHPKLPKLESVRISKHQQPWYERQKHGSSESSQKKKQRDCPVNIWKRRKNLRWNSEELPDPILHMHLGWTENPITTNLWTYDEITKNCRSQFWRHWVTGMEWNVGMVEIMVILGFSDNLTKLKA